MCYLIFQVLERAKMEISVQFTVPNSVLKNQKNAYKSKTAEVHYGSLYVTKTQFRAQRKDYYF